MTENNDHVTRPAPAPAVVCDMSDAPDTGEQRLREYASLFAAAFIARERTDTRVRWRLRANRGIEAWARDLAARENACCAFMTNTITVVDGQVLWDNTTIDDPAALAVQDLFFDLPESRWPSVDAICVTADGAMTARDSLPSKSSARSFASFDRRGLSPHICAGILTHPPQFVG